MAHGNLVKILAWYDNEWGYSSRVAELVGRFGARWSCRLSPDVTQVADSARCLCLTPNQSRQAGTVRVDFNVPVQDGVITDDTRLSASLETILSLKQRDATVILLSHRGRPKALWCLSCHCASSLIAWQSSSNAPSRSLQTVFGPVAEQAVQDAQPGDILLLKTQVPRRRNKQRPRLCAIALRGWESCTSTMPLDSAPTNASTAGVAAYLPSFAGYLLSREVYELNALIERPKRPFVFIVGGLKVADKIGVLEQLSLVADAILVGGAMAFTFSKPRASMLVDPKLRVKRDYTRRGALWNARSRSDAASCCRSTQSLRERSRRKRSGRVAVDQIPAT